MSSSAYSDSGGGGDRPPKGVRDQLAWAKRRVDRQTERLNRIASSVEARERSLFEKVVKLRTTGDGGRAERYSVELAEVRKLKEMVRALRSTLDAVSLKLDSAVSLGDAISALSEARKLVGGMTKGLLDMEPEVGRSMEEIGDVLSSTMQSLSDIYIPQSEGAEQILREAEAVVDVRQRQSEPTLA